MIKPLKPKNIFVCNRSDKSAVAKDLGCVYTNLDDLLTNSDLVLLSLPYVDGPPVLSDEKLGKLRKGSIIVNVARPGLVDFLALKPRLIAGHLYAAYDIPPVEDFSDIPIQNFFTSNQSTAYNTFSANKLIGESATNSLINLLKTGNDDFRVI